MHLYSGVVVPILQCIIAMKECKFFSNWFRCQWGSVVCLKALWSCKPLVRFYFFGWRLLLERLPTHTNLARWGIINGIYKVYPIWFATNECVVHLFIECPTTRQVWIVISDWLGLDVVAYQVSLVSHFYSFCNLVGLKLIWIVVCWVIWQTRNDILFQGGILIVRNIVGKVKFHI